MHRLASSSRIVALAAVVLLSQSVPRAQAQYPYPAYSYPSGTWPYPIGPYSDPYYGYLSGAGQVIQAQANYMIAQQQAALLREQVRQAQLENHRRRFDEWQYQRANMPSLEEDRERYRREAVRRAQNDPPLTEILSADSLNTLLVDCQILHSRGFCGPAIPLDENLLQRINVTSVGGGGTTELLRQERWHWPMLLQRSAFQADRARLTTLVPEASRQAGSGQPVGETLEDILLTTERLDQGVTALAKTADDVVVTPTELYRSHRFLREVRDSMKTFKQPVPGRRLRRPGADGARAGGAPDEPGAAFRPGDIRR